MVTKNPFRYRGSLNPEEDKDVLIDREEANWEFIKRLVRGQYLSLIGARQIGKTTFLKRLPSRIEHELPNPIFLFVDLQTYASYNLEEIYQHLGQTIIKHLPQKLQREVKKPPSCGNEFKALLSEICHRHKGKVVLILDEFEGIASRGRGNANDLLSCLRAIKHESSPEFRKLNVIIAGHIDLYEFGNISFSPYLNVSAEVKLKEFELKDTKRLGKVLFERLNIPFEEAMVRKIHQATAGFPYLVQKIYSLIFDAIVEEERVFAGKLVDEIVDRIVEERHDLSTIMIKTIEENMRFFEPTIKILDSKEGKIEKKELDSEDIRKLELLSAIKEEGGFLYLRNPIIERKLRNHFGDKKRAEIYLIHNRSYEAAKYKKRIKGFDPTKDALEILDNEIDRLDLDSTCNLITQMAIIFFGFDRARLYFLREKGLNKDKPIRYEFELVSAHERDSKEPDKTIEVAADKKGTIISFQEAQEGVFKEVFDTGEQVFIENSQKDKRVNKEFLKLFNPRSFIATPLKSRDRVFGIIVTDKEMSENEISPNDIDSISTFMRYASKLRASA